jgi:hypothetical protein
MNKSKLCINQISRSSWIGGFKEFTITCTDSEKTSFHVVGNDIIPYSHFDLAKTWHSAGTLTPESKSSMDHLIAKYFKDNG